MSRPSMRSPLASPPAERTSRHCAGLYAFILMFVQEHDACTRGFLHIYHYNGWHSTKYHSYDDTDKFTILILHLLHFHHICLCGMPQRPDTLAHSQQVIRNVVIAHVLLLSSPFPTGGSHNFSHCQVGPTGQIHLPPPAPLPSSALQARWRRWGSRRRGGRARPRPGRLVSAGAHGSSVQARTWGGCN